MHEQIKKKKREREKDQTKASEANIKHNIDNFYLVVRFRKISFLKGSKKAWTTPRNRSPVSDYTNILE